MPFDTSSEFPYSEKIRKSRTQTIVEQLVRLADVVKFLGVSLAISAVIDIIWSYFGGDEVKTVANLIFRGYTVSLIYNFGCPLIGKFSTFLIQTMALAGLIISYRYSIENYNMEQVVFILKVMALATAQLFIKFTVMNAMERRMVTLHMKH